MTAVQKPIRAKPAAASAPRVINNKRPAPRKEPVRALRAADDNTPPPPCDAEAAEAQARKRRFVHVARNVHAQFAQLSPLERWERVSSGQWHFRGTNVVGDNYRHLIANECNVRGNNITLFGDGNRIYGNNVTVNGNDNHVYGIGAVLNGQNNVQESPPAVAPPLPEPPRSEAAPALVPPTMVVLPERAPERSVADDSSTQSSSGDDDDEEENDDGDGEDDSDDSEEEEEEEEEEQVAEPQANQQNNNAPPPPPPERVNMRSTGNVILDAFLISAARQPENREYFVRYNIIGSEVLPPVQQQQQQTAVPRRQETAQPMPVAVVDETVHNKLMPKYGEQPENNKWKVSLLDLEGESKTPARPDMECCICYTAERDVLFEPCGHLSCCRGCSRQLYERGAKCPQCRDPVEFARIIFY